MNLTTSLTSCAAAAALLVLLPAPVPAGEIPPLALPPRPSDALTGTQIRDAVTSLSQEAREEFLLREFRRGNVPAFLRTLCPVPVTDVASTGPRAVIYVTPDYLAFGSDTDFFRMPMTPALAQRLADLTSTTLPTRKMVDAIYQAAEVKLAPAPIPPSHLMVTVPVFWEHEQTVRAQRATHPAPAGALTAGQKKDVILSIMTPLRPPPPRVCIYGWHQPDGRPIQPLTTVHKASYADYSHGVRLVSRTMTLDGRTTDTAAVLRDPRHFTLLSDEPQPFPSEPRYP